MSPCRHPLHCIVPPHILQALLKHEDERVRRSARRTLLATARQQERRHILGRLPARGVVGDKRRTIYDARHAWSPAGKVARSEGGPTAVHNFIQIIQSLFVCRPLQPWRLQGPCVLSYEPPTPFLSPDAVVVSC